MQWGIRVNIKLYSSEKSAVVPAMLWWIYPCIHALVLWGFGILCFSCRFRCTQVVVMQLLGEIQATGLLVWWFTLHDVQRTSWKFKFLFIYYFFILWFWGGKVQQRTFSLVISGENKLLPQTSVEFLPHYLVQLLFPIVHLILTLKVSMNQIACLHQ